MVAKTRAVTAKALQALLTRIGSASSGTKDVLLQRLSRDLWRRRLFDLRPDWKARQEKDWGRKLRIVSIDMGIKNLAYCDAEIDYPPGNGLNATMEIVRWDKIDLVSATRGYRSHLPNPRLVKEGSVDADEDVDPYSLQVLSHTAYHFVRSTILNVRPDVILIERQRWRSASSAAIQQWTVRVNTLEAMIWANLLTLRNERIIVLERLRDHDEKRDYEVFGVDPKRVGQYWLGQHARALADSQKDSAAELTRLAADDDAGTETETKKIPRSKAEKKAKIAVLRSWLAGEQPSTAPSTPASDHAISFELGHGASKAREALRLPTSSRSKKPAKRGKSVDEAKNVDGEDIKDAQIKKLDDITDCFLQAAAWVAWESNRKELSQIWDAKRRTGGGRLLDLDEETLRAMLDKVEQGR